MPRAGDKWRRPTPCRQSRWRQLGVTEPVRCHRTGPALTNRSGATELVRHRRTGPTGRAHPAPLNLKCANKASTCVRRLLTGSVAEFSLGTWLLIILFRVFRVLMCRASQCGCFWFFVSLGVRASWRLLLRFCAGDACNAFLISRTSWLLNVQDNANRLPYDLHAQ